MSKIYIKGRNELPSHYSGKTLYYYTENQCPISFLPMFSAPPAAPGTLSATFRIPRVEFTITWNEPLLNMNETIDAYFVNISGPNDLCGTGNTLKNVTELNYTCTIQTEPQEGETYTITVVATSCGGTLRGLQSAPTHLQG